jgi:SSS family solute:Na+ symporter
MAIFMFIACLLVCTFVSLATQIPDYYRIKGLSFGTLTEEDKKENMESFNKADVILSVCLVALVIFILCYFTG